MRFQLLLFLLDKSPVQSNASELRSQITMPLLIHGSFQPEQSPAYRWVKENQHQLLNLSSEWVAF
jgi:hypothetical protein